MRKLILIAAMLVATVTTATASGYEYLSTCDSAGNCISYFGPRLYDNRAKIINVTPAETDDERDARVQAWADTCKPIRTTDAEGITRMRYSAACPNGVAR